MKKTDIRVALLYDFDGTLAPGNMHEHGFIEKMGLKTEEFWEKSDTLALTQNADSNLAYMLKTLEEAKKYFVKPKKTYTPNPENSKIYAEYFENYKKIYEAVRGLV